ncbi:chemotaxis protein CheW [Fulvivirga lutimaris]|uniref:chemotaxis protein CheW n=1 Tax=Fulvivirga lutimaris TaxID=1819566 RepID=UPI0012BBB3F7|nr:chemotaxis protein CheW [Fulvivirga lutimaris]MTI39890.1 purine-binding chemotaxis protein CheW [Fulvivirga lutimaris]
MLEDNKHLLLFSLKQELFGISVKNVTRVINLEKIIKIPKAPTFVVGAINLEGHVIPVVDLANKIDLGITEVNEDKKVIVLEILREEEETMEVGVIIDEVLDVVALENNALAAPPLDNMGFNANCLDGMYKTGEDFYMVISASKIFESELETLVQ